ncbi:MULTISPECIES: type III toxin-antitoxin system ToxN/AbiQ family toxin [Citrobacter freundii complex]|uniref:type III toxin-antitoxin system ToxN/AbiQ family toxin n=1 Tax=Citrobacter freundii complex TaxID=1344959 RepID=UPI0014830463|nr:MULTISPECIES: type III toxin-antitoxin system ToxN/AbiQ family toxin [Citrobacter freundii complex]MBQ4938338.1 type III toxin-antitoxin system ToxN/AbiQ family toxin [Citrobacter werkmanii]MBQ4951106.1 type III toxin-antitoxin system ToxN/AbiQ family toxin [Citrobacter werkmanii]
MKFYTVSDSYISHLKNVDDRVPDNYGGGRAFIGIVLEVNGLKYLAPLTSYKAKQDKIAPSTPTIFKLHERNNPENKLGMICLNNMLPVTDEVIELLDIDAQPKRYQKMLYRQFEFIKLHTDDIEARAQNLYKMITVDKHTFFSRISCDFELLEQASASYPSK